MKRIVFFLCAFSAAVSLAVIEDVSGFTEEPSRFSFRGNVETTLSSGYLATSGLICDTRPVLSHCANLCFDCGDWGFVDGYAWTISSLHNFQHDDHRALFNEFEGCIRYGYDIKLAEGVMLDTKAGPLWNPPIGYYHSHQNYWGPYIAQFLQNPYVVPYWNGLWMVAPKQRGRVRMGLRKTISVFQDFTVTPSIETVWMDRRRFTARYGSEPEENRFLGGAFATMTCAIQASYRISPEWTVYAAYQQFDIFNPQARRAVKRSDDYWAKCDWPIFRIGARYSF